MRRTASPAIGAATGATGAPTCSTGSAACAAARWCGPDERQVLVFDSGVTWELLGELPPYPVDFLRVTYPPGSTSSSDGGG